MVLEVIHGTSKDLHQFTKRSCFNVTEATGDLCRVKPGGQRMRLLEGLKELVNLLFLVIIKFIIQKQLIWKKIPLHMKKP